MRTQKLLVLLPQTQLISQAGWNRCNLSSYLSTQGILVVRAVHQNTETDTKCRAVDGEAPYSKHQRERERERYYTYPALRLIQVLPGHPLADSKDETVSSLQRRTSL